MYKRGTGVTYSDMYCEECGSKMVVPRTRSDTREIGHWKTMFCYKCGKDTRFKEVRQKDFTLDHVLKKENKKT